MKDLTSDLDPTVDYYSTVKFLPTRIYSVACNCSLKFGIIEKQTFDLVLAPHRPGPHNTESSPGWGRGVLQEMKAGRGGGRQTSADPVVSGGEEVGGVEWAMGKEAGENR